MIVRLLLFGMIAAMASASTVTYTFGGVSDGTVGTQGFTQADFTIIFTSDTSDVSHPSAIPADWSTPSGTPAIFMISGIGMGTLLDNQAVFVHPNPENDVGIWHYNSADFLAKQESVFSTYDLKSSLGPISDGVNAWPAVFPGGAFNTSMGSLVLSNVSELSFTADVTNVARAPEPSTGMLLSMGIGGIVLGTRFRKRK